ncbi:MAG: Lrp/AsnC family transcriptional regulator [Methanomassiliicoccaceae archaeon]|jgi:Lrp/AsnC family transcriptional regulator for asnA, asnC and gidA|nr:Lrp/AsnC family transcriptional regulator [Methanomassiliicoccaceae archaeon]
MTEEMDAKDIEILEILRKDSRTSMSQIGDSLKISKATVSRRIAKLEDDKVIMNHSLEIDPSKLDVVKSLLCLQVRGSSVSYVIDDLSRYEEVRYIYKSFGDHHLVCEVYTKNVEDLYEMIQSRILKNQSVRSIEVNILVERLTVDENADLKLYRSENPLK